MTLYPLSSIYIEKKSIKSLREQVAREIQEETLKMAAQIRPGLRNLHIYWQGKKLCLTNICEIWPSYLPLGSTHTVTAIGYIDHCGQEKLVVKLDDGILYHAEDNLKQ